MVAGEHTLLLEMLDNLHDSVPDQVKSLGKSVLSSDKNNELIQQVDEKDPAKWRNIRCDPSPHRDSLCLLVSKFPGATLKSRFLPVYPGAVFVSRIGTGSDIAKDLQRMIAFKEGSLSSSCSDVSASGRTLVALSSSSESQQQLDISLCNIIIGGADYLYVPSTNRLYVLFDPLNNVSLFLVSLLVVYLMITMGHNLQVVLGVVAQGDSRGSGGWWTVASMILLLLLSCFFCTSSNSAANAFVTLEDRIAFFGLVAHVVYYCVRISLDLWLGDGRRANAVNPMLACIWIAVQKVYGSAENPYSAVLFFVMLTWALHKMSVLCHKLLSGIAKGSVAWIRGFDVMVDSAVLCILVYSGCMGQMQMESSNAAISLLQGILAAMMLNRAVMPLNFISNIH